MSCFGGSWAGWGEGDGDDDGRIFVKAAGTLGVLARSSLMQSWAHRLTRISWCLLGCVAATFRRERNYEPTYRALDLHRAIAGRRTNRIFEGREQSVAGDVGGVGGGADSDGDSGAAGGGPGARAG